MVLRASKASFLSQRHLSLRSRPIIRSVPTASILPQISFTLLFKPTLPLRLCSSRQLHSTRLLFSNTESHHVSQLSADEYHQKADEYIDALVAELEAIQEEREEVDVEYSSGVLTLIFPPAGTYVLNKQPPNKQIWLSSPISGPKRYDYIAGANSDIHGHWMYLRDQSTLTDLLRKELGVTLEEK